MARRGRQADPSVVGCDAAGQRPRSTGRDHRRRRRPGPRAGALRQRRAVGTRLLRSPDAAHRRPRRRRGGGMSLVVPAAEALLAARDTGEDVEVYGLHREVTTVAAGNAGLLRQVDRSEVLGIGVRLLVDGRIGYASTTDLGPAGLADVL